MKVTLRQIAEKTGVSVNTVSLALRGMSNISDETREKVVRAARELGYHKRLKTPAGRRNLCLVSTGMHLQDSYFYMEFYQLFLSYASAHGYTMLAMEAEYFQNNSAEIRDRLAQSAIGGILSLGDMKEEMFQTCTRAVCRLWLSERGITGTRCALLLRTTSWQHTRRCIS